MTMKSKKIGNKKQHRFPYAAQIEKNQREDQQYFNGKLVGLPTAPAEN